MSCVCAHAIRERGARQPALPTNKAGTAFTKPVDRTVGEAIEAWEAVRLAQPRLHDAGSASWADMLLADRGARLG